MYPWLMTNPPVPAYGAFLVLAVVCAWLLARRQARQRGLDPSHVDILVPLLMASGVVGAWLFGLWTRQLTGSAAGGLVLAGALVACTLAGILYSRLAALPLGILGDLMAAPAALAIAIGRLGCLLAGCCYGNACPAAWPESLGLHFPPGSVAFAEHVWAGLLDPHAAATPPLIPVQLIEAAACALLAGCLWKLSARIRQGSGIDGEAFLALGIGYGCLRFALEFLRADNPSAAGPLTFSQSLMPLLVAASLATGWIRRRWAGYWGLKTAPAAPLPRPEKGKDAPAAIGAHP
jgi:phosphatidylglycerol:prolipoprotein diacylglycerol transferase